MEKSKVRGFAIAFLIIAAIGFADAGYLTWKHYANTAVPCFITTGCDTVTTSSYAVVAGIPVALGGAFYYLVMVIGAMLAIETGRTVWLKRMTIFSLCGLAASIYLVSVMAFVLHAYCIYCFGSAATSTLLFILSAFLWPKLRRGNNPPPTPIPS